MSLIVISSLTFILYISTVFIQYQSLLKNQGHNQQAQDQTLAKKFILKIGFLAILLHGYILYRFIDTPLGQNLNISSVFSLITWVIAITTLLSAIKVPLENLLLLIFPVTALSLPLLFLYSTPDFFQTKHNFSQLFHILISIFAFSLLGMAAFQASLLFLQNQSLRTKKPKNLLHFLPPLETMEIHLFRTITVGFILLSVALLSVFLFSNTLDILNSSARLPKILLSCLAWVFFAILLLGHSIAGWRGIIAIRWTLSGMFILIVAYFGSKLIFLSS